MCFRVASQIQFFFLGSGSSPPLPLTWQNSTGHSASWLCRGMSAGPLPAPLLGNWKVGHQRSFLPFDILFLKIFKGIFELGIYEILKNKIQSCSVNKVVPVLGDIRFHYPWQFFFDSHLPPMERPHACRVNMIKDSSRFSPADCQTVSS